MKQIQLACLAVALLAFAGCGQGSGVASVTGLLLIDGQPAPEGIALSFDPVEAGSRVSAGFTDANGRFEAIYSISKKGVKTGECVVRLANGIDMAPPEPGKPLNRKYPDEYYTKIETITVGSWGNDIELNMTSKK